MLIPYSCSSGESCHEKIFVATIILVSLFTLFVLSSTQIAAQKTETDELTAKLAENRVITRRYMEEVWDKGDIAAAYELIDEVNKRIAQIVGNREIARRYMEEVWNKGNMAAADEIIAEDFVNHNPFGPLPPDREGLKIAASGIAAAPGTFTVDHIIAEGDTVAIRTPFHGNPEFDAIVILRIKDGKITDRWGYGDHDAKQAEANKVLATRYMEELWNEGKLELADELLSEDFVSYVLPAGGREAIKSAIPGFHTDFPNGYFVIDELFVTADKIVIRGALVANAPPEGTEPERINHNLMILSVKDGKITERWIGLVPAEEK